MYGSSSHLPTSAFPKKCISQQLLLLMEMAEVFASQPRSKRKAKTIGLSLQVVALQPCMFRVAPVF
jgi:hypothetical protein